MPEVHDFVLTQGQRRHRTTFIKDHASISIPTQHGYHLMASQLEVEWARRFEFRGYSQAPPNSIPTSLPCYFYEPAGMKKWSSYTIGKYYWIDFVLVYEIEAIAYKSVQRARAIRWEWISIKPEPNELDLQHLQDLVKFDSRHQRAFQCCGHPQNSPIIRKITYNPQTSECNVS